MPREEGAVYDQGGPLTPSSPPGTGHRARCRPAAPNSRSSSLAARRARAAASAALRRRRRPAARRAARARRARAAGTAGPICMPGGTRRRTSVPSSRRNGMRAPSAASWSASGSSRCRSLPSTAEERMRERWPPSRGDRRAGRPADRRARTRTAGARRRRPSRPARRCRAARCAGSTPRPSHAAHRARRLPAAPRRSVVQVVVNTMWPRAARTLPLPSQATHSAGVPAAVAGAGAGAARRRRGSTRWCGGSERRIAAERHGQRDVEIGAALRPPGRPAACTRAAEEIAEGRRALGVDAAARSRSRQTRRYAVAPPAARRGRSGGAARDRPASRRPTGCRGIAPPLHRRRD